MKVEFFCDNGANHASCRAETFDTFEDFNLEEGEWEGLTMDEKQEYVDEWAFDRLDIGFIEKIE